MKLVSRYSLNFVRMNKFKYMLGKILSYLHTLDASPNTPLKETDVSQGIKTAIGPTDS
jgi:hypothetical protein